MNIKYLLSAFAFVGLLSQPAVAESLSANDLGFAFGSEMKPELNAVDSQPSSVALMTEEEMLTTEGERFGLGFRGSFLGAPRSNSIIGHWNRDRDFSGFHRPDPRQDWGRSSHIPPWRR